MILLLYNRNCRSAPLQRRSVCRFGDESVTARRGCELANSPYTLRTQWISDIYERSWGREELPSASPRPPSLGTATQNEEKIERNKGRFPNRKEKTKLFVCRGKGCASAAIRWLVNLHENFILQTCLGRELDGIELEVGHGGKLRIIQDSVLLWWTSNLFRPHLLELHAANFDLMDLDRVLFINRTERRRCPNLFGPRL